MNVFEISLSSAAKGDRPAPLCLSAIFGNIGWRTPNHIQTLKSYPVLMNITSNNGVRIPKPHYVDSFTHPVERVQYPTVAVCPPQLEAAATGEETYDPWQGPIVSR